MSIPKKKLLKKQVRKVEDELGVDSTIEDIVDGILNLFDDDDDDDSDDSDVETDSSDTDTDDSDDDDFGGGDFGGGGASSDW